MLVIVIDPEQQRLQHQCHVAPRMNARIVALERLHESLAMPLLCGDRSAVRFTANPSSCPNRQARGSPEFRFAWRGGHRPGTAPVGGLVVSVQRSGLRSNDPGGITGGSLAKVAWITPSRAPPLSELGFRKQHREIL